MDGSYLRVLDDIALVRDDGFVGLCRKRPVDFTRIRKLSPGTLVLSVLARRGRSLAFEVRDLQKAALTKGGISVVGYLKQRLKLNPQALLYLARHHAAQFYRDKDATDDFKGYLLLAADGSTLNVPTTPETIEVYGDAAVHGRSCAMCGISCLFDVLNRQIINLIITRGGFDERGQVPAHVRSAAEVVGNRPWIFIGDRGYPSLALCCRLSDAQVPFVIRVPSTFLRTEFLAMKTDDEDVSVKLTPSRCSQYRLTDPDAWRMLKERGHITLRLVKVPIGKGSKEFVVTSLSRDRFSAADIAEIYRLRWGIETVFSFMKDKLQMENFTGTKPVLIEQDVFATAYLVNVMFDLAQDAERKLHERDRAHPGRHKHEMTINKTFAIGVVKDEMIRFVLAPGDQKEVIMAGIIKELSCHIVPIRKDRAYTRNMNVRQNRYSNTHKRAF
jgi:hypothetical protein